MINFNTNNLVRYVAAALLMCAIGTANADVKPFFTEDFNSFAGGKQNTTQVDTHLKLSVGGNLPGWKKLGSGTAHAVDRSGSGDFAVMIWHDNVITLEAGIAANDRDTTYEVKFEASPSVYAHPGQATSANDGIVIDILETSGRVLATHTHQPGSWKGDKQFTSARFQYAGRGTGAVRFHIRPLTKEGRFGGAIDNLTVSRLIQSPAARHFDNKIAPMLAAHCLECHSGPEPKGELDLSFFDKALAGGESGVVIVPGDLDDSLFWEQIEAGDMPPKHSLSADEKTLFQDWIREGAKWGTSRIDPFQYSSDRRAGYDWWSLQSLRPIKPPQPNGSSSATSNEIDQFIAAKLKQAGLSASAPASPRLLVRRLYIDLIGLPPSAEVIDKFAADPSPQAWGNLVDELLASKHYGERWARHWLDIVRFGESDGYEYNSPRETSWHYRDWVIRAMNADMPYDQFARMQLAGDALKPESLEGQAATGFLVAGVHNAVVGKSLKMKNMARQDELEDLVGTVSQTFLGLTVNCARCHDHKFDPISTEEYYQFVAAFAGVNHGKKKGDPSIYSVVSSKPPAMRVHHRGSVMSLGKEVFPNGLRAIKDVEPMLGLGNQSTDYARRMKLADWITNDKNGPFARVIVNRVWHYHFGQGIVDTPSDFGFNGSRPSHPELLEWLAIWFRDNDYSLKKLHKLIVTSSTYQQSSQSNSRAVKVDAGNRLLWRQNPRRVEAEVLRDSMLEIAGKLNRKQFGPGYRDVKIVKVPPAFYYEPIEPVGAEFDRRTIYRWQVRGQRSALLDTFDCPDPSAKTPKRSVTTTPSQALSQWNHPFVLRVSQQLATRVINELGAKETEKQVSRVWRLVLGRYPTGDEKAKSLRLVEDHGLALLCRVLLNSNEFVLID